MNLASRLVSIHDFDPCIHTLFCTELVKRYLTTSNNVMLIDIFIKYHQHHFVINCLRIEIEILIPLWREV
jgi:hypothetical protein